jgi:phage baseplate assembly protein W
MKGINIKFPFRDAEEGSFLKLNKTSLEAIRSNLIHLIMTEKGERWYLPEFGTNLKKFIFEQYDNVTKNDIKRQLNDDIQKWIPNLEITDILVENDSENEYAAVIEIKYEVTEDVFRQSDVIVLKL